MNGTIISDVKSKVVTWGNISNQGKAQKTQEQDCFSAVFDKTKNPAQENQSDTSSKTENTQKPVDIRETKASRQLKEQGEKAKAVKSEDVEETAGKMVEEIARTFDITEEEVELVLENLGLTVVDLLNAENLTKVVLALNPGCDALSLMTNEELFADLKGLMNTAQELKNQLMQNFNLTEAEFMSETEVITESEVMTESAADAILKNSYNEKNDLEAVDMTDTFGEVVAVPKTEISQDVRNGSAETKEDNGNVPAQQFVQNFVNQLAEAVENTSNTTTTYGVSGREIINQITEQIRIHVKQDTTEMELQLHPASLGNVKVQIASTGGVLTAIFTTENETVKAALEAQLVQLKENFTEQGLKVESVEVNVATQGFERSLDQQEQEQNRYESNKGRKTNRRIRLSGLEDSDEFLAEDMSTDDRIVADMMIRNGNTVDYTV